MSSEREPPGHITGMGVMQEIGPWQVHIEWPPNADQGGPWYLTVRPNPQASPEELTGGLSTTVLRQVNFQAAANEWRKFAGVTDRHATVFREFQEHINNLDHALKDRIDKGVNESYLAWLSLAYVYLVNAGEDSVTRNLAELVGRQPETIRAHLKMARAAKLLTTVKGKAGGHLTEKSEAIIRQEIESE